jgi:hypothetical protein
MLISRFSAVTLEVTVRNSCSLKFLRVVVASVIIDPVRDGKKESPLKPRDGTFKPSSPLGPLLGLQLIFRDQVLVRCPVDRLRLAARKYVMRSEVFAKSRVENRHLKYCDWVDR